MKTLVLAILIPVGVIGVGIVAYHFLPKASGTTPKVGANAISPPPANPLAQITQTVGTGVAIGGFLAQNAGDIADDATDVANSF